MKSNGISFLLFVGLILSTKLHAQENGSVGIGTETPNPNALLHLVSPGNNQGILIPSMTTAQRTSASFVTNLNSDDNGLLVFDVTDKDFYFWKDDSWQSFSSSSQSLTFDPSTNQLTIVGGNSIDLSPLAVQDWNQLLNIPEDFVDGTDEVNDADADPTNEIQDLRLNGNTLSITNNSSATSVDLSNLGSDNQDLVFRDGVITLSGDPDATAINLSGYDANSADDFDGQYSSLTGVPADLADGDQVDDADADPSNEIQSLQLNNEVLSLSGDVSGTTINFQSWDQNVLDDFDGQFSSLSGVPSDLLDGDQVDDADADATNEIQDLNIVGTVLRITNNPGATEIDLSAFSGGGIQDLTFVDGVISLSADPDNTQIDLSTYDTDVSDDFDGQFSSLTGIPADLADGDQIEDADADPGNEIQLLSTNNSPGNISLSSDKTLTLNVSDADADPANELQRISTNSTPGNITLSDDKTISLNVNDADASSSNELITATTLRPGNVLRIQEAGVNFDVDLTELVDDADADDSNELITSASLQPGNILRINEASTSHDVDLSTLATDADADPNNELQTLSYNYSNFLLTLSDQSTVIDLSSLNNASPWEDNGTSVAYDGLFANANNFTSTPKTERLVSTDFITNRIDQADIEDSKFVPVYVNGGTSMLSFIEPGRQGQELVLMVIGAGQLQMDGENGNLHLSDTSHLLVSGSTIHLVYFKDLINGTGFDGWMELSKSISTR